MRVVPPLEISDTVLTSSTATEPHAPAAYNAATTYATGTIVSVAADFKIYESLQPGNLAHTPLSSPTWWRVLGRTETAYNAATTYALGDTVSSSHRIYESLAAGNTGNPLPVLPETTTVKWIDVGPTNRWAMFDLYRDTQTVAASPLTVVLTPGLRINAIALFGLVATSVHVTMTSGGSSVYDETMNLNTREVIDWYSYFFAPFSTRPSMARFNLPPYTNGIITVVITNSAGNVFCGGLVIGSYVFIGIAQENAESDALNFSVIERDAFGNAKLIPRRSIPKTNQRVMFDKSLVTTIASVRKLLNARPALWSTLDDASTNDFFDAMLILGIYKNFRLTLVDPKSFGDIEIEEI